MKAIIKIILPSIPIVCLGQQKVCVYNDDEVLGNDTINKTANNVFQEDYKLPNISAYLGDKTVGLHPVIRGNSCQFVANAASRISTNPTNADKCPPAIGLQI